MIETTTRSEEYLVPNANLDALKDRIADLNKRAKRLHCTSITLEVLGYETKIDEHEMARIYHKVRITGERPVLKDWCVIAIARYLYQVEIAGKDEKEDVCLLDPIPGMVSTGELEPWRTMDTSCDHCHTARYRNVTFILRHETTGEHKRVGSGCLKDFTGHEDPHHVSAMAEILAEANKAAEDYTDDDLLGGAGGFGRGTSQVVDLRFFLNWVALSIRLDGGWVSRSESNESAGFYTRKAATYELAMDRIDQARKYPDSKEIERPNDDDKKLAADALEWIRSDETTEWIRSSERAITNKALMDPGSYNAASAGYWDYMYNLENLGKMVVVPTWRCSMASGIIQRYLNRKADLLKLRRKAQVSEYQGEEGERKTWMLIVESVKQIQNTYAGRKKTTFIHEMSDEKGNVFKWFASNENLPTGVWYSMVGTVKEYRVYQGVKETHLSRCNKIERLCADGEEEESQKDDLES